MKTYREFVTEAAGSGFAKMSDTDFERWVKANPSAAEKARKVRAAAQAQANSGQGSFNKQGNPRTRPSGRKPGFKMPNVKMPQGAKQVAGRSVGPALTAVDAALTYKGRRDAGESRKRAAAGTATQVGTAAASGWAGAKAGAALGSALGPKGALVGGLIGGGLGYAAGSEVGKKAFNVAAGATPQQKSALAQKTRQSQAGGALVGTGGKTTFDTKKNTMTTGGKTVNLAKTSVVKDPTTGKLATGHLAYKDGKAVYKRAADPSTLAKTSSNPFERIGRTLNPGAYAKSDAAARAKDLQKAAASDIKRQQALGVKGSQNLVGPKIVGPKIVGSGGGNPGRRGQGSRK